jgi:hypothetical protein
VDHTSYLQAEPMLENSDRLQAMQMLMSMVFGNQVEAYRWPNPYQYGSEDPTMFVDPDGMGYHIPFPDPGPPPGWGGIIPPGGPPPLPGPIPPYPGPGLQGAREKFCGTLAGLAFAVCMMPKQGPKPSCDNGPMDRIKDCAQMAFKLYVKCAGGPPTPN